MKNKKYTVQKIPIMDLITALNQAYEIGADFIDLTVVCKGEEERDQLLIDIKDGYYAEEEGDNDKLDENDFNNLIG